MFFLSIFTWYCDGLLTLTKFMNLVKMIAWVDGNLFVFYGSSFHFMQLEVFMIPTDSVQIKQRDRQMVGCDGKVLMCLVASEAENPEVDYEIDHQRSCVHLENCDLRFASNFVSRFWVSKPPKQISVYEMCGKLENLLEFYRGQWSELSFAQIVELVARQSRGEIDVFDNTGKSNFIFARHRGAVVPRVVAFELVWVLGAEPHWLLTLRSVDEVALTIGSRLIVGD